MAVFGRTGGAPAAQPQIIITPDSAGQTPAPPGYEWGPDGKLRPITGTTLDANGNPIPTQAAAPTQTDTNGVQYDASGKPLQPGAPAPAPGTPGSQFGGFPVDAQGRPVQGIKVQNGDGTYSQANDHGTVDIHNADGSIGRAGSSGPGSFDSQGNHIPEMTVAGGSLGHSLARNLDPAGIFDPNGMHVGGVLDPANLTGWDKANGGGGGVFGSGGALGGVGDALGGLFGGTANKFRSTPYVAAPPLNIDASPYTQPLQTLAGTSQTSATGYADRQAALADSLLGAPSAAAAAGNAMAQRQAEENNARMASTRGANTALLLQAAGQSADSRARDITSQAAVDAANEQVARYGAAGGLLQQAAGTKQAGINTGVSALGTAGQIGTDTAKANAGNQLATQGINAGSYDNSQNVNAGISKDNTANTGKWIDRGLQFAGTTLALASDMRGKENIHAVPTASFRDLLELAAPQGNRENLAPVEPSTFSYRPLLAKATGQDTAQRPGVMAQDLERAPAMSSAVVETPNGKAIDVPRGLSLSLAANAGLDKRLQLLEQAVGADDRRKRDTPYTASLRQLGKSSPARASY